MELLLELQKLGLNEIESKIYLSLSKYTEQTTVSLSKETGINRRTIYDNLDILAKKGLITYKIINGTKIFSANSVHILRQLIDEKLFTLKKILPSLENIQKSHFEKTKIEILLGKQGVKTIIEEAINSKETFYWVGGGLHILETFHFSKYMQIKFKQLNIKLLEPNIKQVKDRISFFKNLEVRYLPKSLVSGIGFIIYEKTLVIGQLKDNEIISIIIKSEEFANTFKKYFNLLWSVSK